MMTFRNHHLRDFAVPMGTKWLLNDIAEAKGKQGLYTHQSPQMLKALREKALVQSVECYPKQVWSKPRGRVCF